MKRFAYTAVASDGQRIEGEMDAADESSVIDNLQTSGYLPVATNEIVPDSSDPARGGDLVGELGIAHDFAIQLVPSPTGRNHEHIHHY